MEWYQNKNTLKDAVDFLIKFGCCYGWNAFASDKTPCCNYKEVDKDVPDELREAIKEYLEDLSKAAYRKLNREISLLLGERFYVRKTVIIKILSRLLADGNPCDNTEMIMYALQMQIRHRKVLLETLRKC